MKYDLSKETPAALNAWCAGTAAEALGIVFTEAGTDYLLARMPVDQRTRQPAGLLHGGASVLLAETLGSVAGNLCIDTKTQACVGLEINANHLRGVAEGWVEGKVTPIHIGRRTQVWQIEIRNGSGQLVCTSRLTLAVIER